VKLTTHLHLVPRLRLSGAVLLHLIYAFMAWTRTTLLSPVLISLLLTLIAPCMRTIALACHSVFDFGQHSMLFWFKLDLNYYYTVSGSPSKRTFLVNLIFIQPVKKSMLFL
jgi:hypothetical protein